MYSNWIYHNSQDAYYRLPFGAVTCAAKIKIRLGIFDNKDLGSIFLRLWQDDGEKFVEMTYFNDDKNMSVYQAEITAPEQPGWLWYYFIIYKKGRAYYYGNNKENLGGVGEIWQESTPPSYQITVYREIPAPPQWFQEAVIYQIFVDRFFNGHGDQILHMKKNSYFHKRWDELPFYIINPYTGEFIFDFFGGNLLGVIEKLPYLKDLGINTIYFNPLFESPSNHKYDTADYKKIDRMFGTNELFQELCQKAAMLGINVILDGVFSHTGSDSIYFNKEGSYPSLGAYQSPESPFYSWYRFIDYPEDYKAWWGVETLPNVNEMEPTYIDFIIEGNDSVLKYWMGHGIKGWRLDVADELPDEFISRFRRVMKEVDQESVLIGEVWEDASKKSSYGKMRKYLMGDELDSVMNYPFRKAVLDFILGFNDAAKTKARLMSLQENYPLYHFYTSMNLIGSHDVPRIITLLGEAPPQNSLPQKEQGLYRLPQERRKLAVARLKLIILWQMTFPGVPSVYYGDEAGVEGYADPLNRAPFPWDEVDQEIFQWYRRLIELRNKHIVLKTGAWSPLYAQDDVFGYMRKIDQGHDVFQRPQANSLMLVFFNRDHKRQAAVRFDEKWPRGRYIDLLNHHKGEFFVPGAVLYLGPLEGRILMFEGAYEE